LPEKISGFGKICRRRIQEENFKLLLLIEIDKFSGLAHQLPQESALTRSASAEKW